MFCIVTSGINTPINKNNATTQNLVEKHGENQYLTEINGNDNKKTSYKGDQNDNQWSKTTLIYAYMLRTLMSES